MHIRLCVGWLVGWLTQDIVGWLVGWLVDPGHCGCTYACAIP
jgi:hypothetical protein